MLNEQINSSFRKTDIYSTSQLFSINYIELTNDGNNTLLCPGIVATNVVIVA